MSGKSCCGAERWESCDCYKESMLEQIIELLQEIVKRLPEPKPEGEA